MSLMKRFKLADAMIEALFDKKLLAARMARHAQGAQSRDFLLRRAGEDMAERLGAISREFPRALDLGAYHGIVGRAIAASDSIREMIYADPCMALLEQGPKAGLVCDAEFLPFAPESFDLVVSALNLHFANDLPGALIQIRRSLKPDGLFLAAVLGGETLRELREAFTIAESEVEGGASPRVIPFADIRDYGALLQRAGFAMPVTDADKFNVTYATPFDLMRELRAMGAANMLNDRSRKPLRRATLFRAAEIYAERYSIQGGRVNATFEIIHLSGWAPHESQPKPLAPGSAKSRLADALGAEEHNAGDKANPRKKP